jgi:hypothetical protein
MPVHIATLLCDAVRPEANNKLSLLGVFGSAIFVPQVPSQLASLAIVQWWEPVPEEVPGTSIMFAMELRGPGITAMRMPEQAMVIPANAGPHRTQLAMVAQIQGFPIAQQGDYQIATFVNGREAHLHTFYAGTPDNQQRERLIGFG